MTGQTDWDAPRVYRYELAEEPERETPQPTPAVVVVASDSEEPAADEERGRRAAPKTPEEDTRVVVVRQTPSPSGSVPFRTVADDVSPRSLEGCGDTQN